MASWGNAAAWGAQQQAPQDVEQQDGMDGTALGWDESISFDDTPDYIVLKPGEYEFEVVSFERGYTNGGNEEWNTPCPTAKVQLRIVAPEGEAIVTHSFFLRKTKQAVNAIGKFFWAIGMARPGEAFTPDWSKAIGRKGRAKIKNKPGRNDPSVLYNNIQSFITPEA